MVVRFIGTTQSSCTTRAVLLSIIAQLARVCGVPPPADPDSYQQLCADFANHLTEATAARPFTLLLDSLEQLGPTDAGWRLAWLPPRLPPHVRVVVSVLRDPSATGAASRAGTVDALYADTITSMAASVPDSIMTVAPLAMSESMGVLDAINESARRCLSPEQLAAVRVGFAQCSLPLYVRMVATESLHWRSFMPPPSAPLPPTIRGLITHYFSELEKQHGHVLVQHALGVLTAARLGLGAREAEDVLSCNDTVLNAVFEWWLPPVRRLPPLVLARLRAALGPFLVCVCVCVCGCVCFMHIFSDVIHSFRTPRRWVALWMVLMSSTGIIANSASVLRACISAHPRLQKLHIARWRTTFLARGLALH